MPSVNEWDEHWLRVADVTSMLSKDPKTKVGSAIVTPDNRQCSIGYNGFAKGIKETEEKWQRPNKYEYVIHSEINNLMNCPFDTRRCSIYLTISPCHRCISSLINAGIIKVVFKELYKNTCHKDIWFEHAKLFQEFYMYNPLTKVKTNLDSISF